MGVARRIIFPILRLIVWAVIAVALCVLAFGDRGASTPGPGGEEPYPGAIFEDPIVEATTQTLENTIVLSGQISPEPAVEVKAAADGKAVYFAMPSGDWVEPGAPLMTIRHTLERDPLERVDEFGNVTTIAQSPHVTETTVIATAAGKITFLAALNDDLAGGDVVARISSEEFFVEADIPPADLYRLIDLPEAATVTIANGPEPFECTDVRFTSTQPGDDGEPGSGTSLRCEIPTSVKVFPGLAASISISTDIAENAVVLPVTAVRGSFESGSVWLIADDGEPVETGVQLGLTDGIVIQISQGISAGDQVLEFVPSSQPQYPDYGNGPEPGDGGWDDGGWDDGGTIDEGDWEELPDGEWAEDGSIIGEEG